MPHYSSLPWRMSTSSTCVDSASSCTVSCWMQQMCFSRDGGDFPRLHSFSWRYTAPWRRKSRQQTVSNSLSWLKTSDTSIAPLIVTGCSYHKPPAYKRYFNLRYLVPRSKDHNRWTGHPPWSKLSRTARIAYLCQLLAHPDPSTLALFTDASDNAVGPVLQNRVCDS